MELAVWYASAGCLPDGDYPLFVGTHNECLAWIANNEEDYKREDTEHDLYSLYIGYVELEELENA